LTIQKQHDSNNEVPTAIKNYDEKALNNRNWLRRVQTAANPFSN